MSRLSNAWPIVTVSDASSVKVVTAYSGAPNACLISAGVFDFDERTLPTDFEGKTDFLTDRMPGGFLDA